VNRTRAWLVVSPVMVAGVLVGHALAYRLTSTPTDGLHTYLGHAPQVLLVLTLCGLVLAGISGRGSAPAPRMFPLVAVSTFVVQEHIERVVHDGAVPLLLTSPSFVVGLVLQIPVALVAWALARWLLGAVGDLHVHPALRGGFDSSLVALLRVRPAVVDGPEAVGRAPPSLLRPC
jgi:hypothetical protein